MDKVILQRKIKEQFNLSEIKIELCLPMHIAWEELPGDTIGEKSFALIEYCERRKSLDKLLELCKKMRISGSWNEVFQLDQQMSPQIKDSNIDKNTLSIEKFRRKREIIEEINTDLAIFHESASQYWVASSVECDNKRKGSRNVKDEEEQKNWSKSLEYQFLKIGLITSKLYLLDEHKIVDAINWYSASVGVFFANIEAGLELNLIPTSKWINDSGEKQNELLRKVSVSLGIAYNKHTE